MVLVVHEEMIMPDTTIEKVEAGSSPRGEMGQKYLVAGKHVSMRLWIIDEPGVKLKAPTTRDYETVGYVISGSAKLDLEGQTLNLKAGDSWLVPAFTDYFPRRSTPLQRHADISRQSAGKVDDLGS